MTKDRGVHGKNTVVTELSPQLLQAVREAAPEGRLTCTDAHKVARQLRVPLLHVGLAADHLGIKIAACQLGCF